MSILSIPFTFSPGTTIVSSQVNSNFSTIYSDYNGNIGNSNLSGSVVIADSKLAQITSASKVSATALTGMASLPSGAGVIPIANIPTIPTSKLSGGLFGARASKTIGTIYQAATDGIVTAYQSSTTGNVQVIGITDSAATPTTTVAWNYLPTSANPQTSSISFPVIKNDYYQVTVSGGSLGYMYWLPIGS